MNMTAVNGYGTMVYFITNYFQPPEIRQMYLDSVIRKLKRNGLAELLPEHMQDQGLNYKYSDLLTGPDVDSDNGMHDDIDLPFFLRTDCPQEQLFDKMKPLADYARTRGFTKAILEIATLGDIEFGRKLIFTNREVELTDD